MSGKINTYVVLKVDFNCKLMFCKINFILPNIYFTNLYSITLLKKTTPFQFFQLLAGPEKCLTTAGFFGRKYLLKSVNKKVAASQLTSFNEPVSL